MTALYRLDVPASAIAGAFGIATGADPWTGGAVAPGAFAPVITAGREAPAGARPERLPWRLVPRLWGVPPPASARDAGRAVITVRNPQSPFWIGNLRHSEFRCLVPATGFMVWGRIDPATNRRRSHWFAPSDQPLFAMAGVWKDSEIPSFALLTCEANALLREAGSERMPAILPADPAAWRAWLHAGWSAVSTLVQSYPSALTREMNG